MKYIHDHHYKPKSDCKLFKTISSSHKSSLFADVNFPQNKSWTNRELDKSCRERLCFGMKYLTNVFLTTF